MIKNISKSSNEFICDGVTMGKLSNLDSSGAIYELPKQQRGTNEKISTKEEYESQQQGNKYQRESEPLFQCPECGGGMRRDEMIVLTSYPPKRIYRCDKCGHVEHLDY